MSRTILTAYDAISVAFSFGFVAGAWWVARSHVCGHPTPDNPGGARRATVFYCLGQRTLANDHRIESLPCHSRTGTTIG
jgi:hypothetical protein